MFRALNKLKSDIVVNTPLETTSIANYSKGGHRINNAHMQNMFLLLLYITHVVPCQCRQLHARPAGQEKSNSAVIIIANKMDGNNKTIVS